MKEQSKMNDTNNGIETNKNSPKSSGYIPPKTTPAMMEDAAKVLSESDPKVTTCGPKILLDPSDARELPASKSSITSSSEAPTNGQRHTEVGFNPPTPKDMEAALPENRGSETQCQTPNSETGKTTEEQQLGDASVQPVNFDTMEDDEPYLIDLARLWNRDRRNTKALKDLKDTVTESRPKRKIKLPPGGGHVSIKRYSAANITVI